MKVGEEFLPPGGRVPPTIETRPMPGGLWLLALHPSFGRRVEALARRVGTSPEALVAQAIEAYERGLGKEGGS